jgi:hypothetical protein
VGKKLYFFPDLCVYMNNGIGGYTDPWGVMLNPVLETRFSSYVSFKID